MTDRAELLEIIDKAAREGVTELDLSGKGITEIPDCIGQLTNLQKLYFEENQITEIPECIGKLTNLQKLIIGKNKITEIPGCISQLNNLRFLGLWENQITEIPEFIGKLTNLKKLSLSANQITEIPEFIGYLNNLQLLGLSRNQITEIPEFISQLTNLQNLYLHDNKITEIPECIGQLTNLQELNLGRNQITEIPECIGQLTNLQKLYLGGNQITEIPECIGQLTNLQKLNLDDNPLNPVVKSAYQSGLDELKAYLRSIQEPDQREEIYEAKLVLVGEGGVGKTTLLKALTGKDPQTNEATTHGVDIAIQALHLPHPQKENVEIKLNAWDFGGQEVYRVTHQFFFSKRSVYLLVWEPRRGVQQCQVEDWLKLLQMRVGDEARVIIISTYSKSGQHIARIDKPVLKRDFGDMIVDFHEVDSLVDDPATGEKVGIAQLKQIIAETAQNFDQMGVVLNKAWRESRDELLAINKPRISYTEFTTVCSTHGLNDIATKTLADLMHDLGYIVYYSEDERLQDDVVLQPEWLTKAIGFVLEDRTTQNMDGILSDNRLLEVWWDNPADGKTRYPSELYPFFLRLMEKYDVSYRLEDGTASLVAQHVPQIRPNLPWLPEEEPANNRRRIATVCVMEESPPGLIPWMIVRTHDYIYQRHEADGKSHRLHWQKGMFLRNKTHGEAMLELRDRELHLYTEAVWPEYFTNILQQTLQKLISDTWPGLEGRYYFAVPCPTKNQGKACMGRFEIGALRQFLEEGDTHYPCQFCRTRHKIVDLLFGLEEEDTREQLSRIEVKVERGFTEIQQNLQEFESRIANYVMGIMQAVASESKRGPRLFTLEPREGNWRRLTSKKYRLHLWCEEPNCQHPVHDIDKGVYEFKAPREWVEKVAPYANLIAGVLKTLTPITAPAANMFFGEDFMKVSNLQYQLEIMKELSNTILSEDKLLIDGTAGMGDGLLSHAERSGILALHSFLHEEDPHHQRLGLKRLPTYTGDYLWLCEKHYQNRQSKMPQF
ncbi:MAG: leucine-rich repeat domain-containing protein [Coleofasciculus sp.]|uniref:leucine-rich repeat domain-containing protein n=1 Tax=Coleofasciculus sp. TaxID=3100458 RepID=UPI003A122AFE